MWIVKKRQADPEFDHDNEFQAAKVTIYDVI